jgi:hypothetical protein
MCSSALFDAISRRSFRARRPTAAGDDDAVMSEASGAPARRREFRAGRAAVAADVARDVASVDSRSASTTRSRRRCSTAFVVTREALEEDLAATAHRARLAQLTAWVLVDAIDSSSCRQDGDARDV